MFLSLRNHPFTGTILPPSGTIGVGFVGRAWLDAAESPQQFQAG